MNNFEDLLPIFLPKDKAEGEECVDHSEKYDREKDGCWVDERRGFTCDRLCVSQCIELVIELEECEGGENRNRCRENGAPKSEDEFDPGDV